MKTLAVIFVLFVITVINSFPLDADEKGKQGRTRVCLCVFACDVCLCVCVRACVRVCVRVRVFTVQSSSFEKHKTIT